MAFDQVSDLTIESEIPIRSFKATEWLGGSINAPSVGNITTSGSRKRGIAGDLDVNVTLQTVLSIASKRPEHYQATGHAILSRISLL